MVQPNFLDANPSNLTISKCKGCGRTIAWIVTRIGDRSPVEPSTTSILTRDGDYVTGHQSHFDYCIEARNLRRPR